jgi:hypothetical protein
MSFVLVSQPHMLTGYTYGMNNHHIAAGRFVAWCKDGIRCILAVGNKGDTSSVLDICCGRVSIRSRVGRAFHSNK